MSTFELGHWKPYKPDEQIRWNLPRVWMLHRRSGFGATWQQLQRDLADGPEKSVVRILDGKSREHVAEDFESTSKFLLEQAIQSGQISRLSAWWILRMYLGPNAFEERRTLMWHNHFATSNSTVQNVFRMYRQNRIFRQHGLKEFGTLLNAAIRDPAMLIWLNANDNRQGHPNENLARELMELFSLGEGNYSEQDVKEAARALAGWTVPRMMQAPEDPFVEPNEDKMSIRNHWQDKFFKTVLGKTGDWDGDGLIKIVLEHPATAKRLAWRVCDDLFGEGVVSDDALAELAEGLTENQLNMRWAFETALNSELFFSNANLKSRVAAPETFVLGNLLALNTSARPASTLSLNEVFTQLGRSLFQPPNVGGWDGGRLWLNARTVVARSNFVHSVVSNGLNRKAMAPDFDGLVEGFENNTDIESVVIQLSELLLGLDRDSENDQRLIVEATKQADQQPAGKRWADTVQLLLNSSSAHLC